MRPLRLRLTGFRSYADSSVDLSRHRLVVITGDTGAGKTSLLDGICFALYSRTPELSSSKELLSLGAAHGEVELAFSAQAGATTWRVTRRFGPEAPEPAHLLERLDDAGETVDRVTGYSLVNARVSELVGMSFATFTAAVLLAQGRFAQFLQASPKDRDTILRQLFGVTGMDAVRAAVLAQRDAHLARAETFDAEGRRQGDVGASARHRAARRVRATATKRARLAALQPLADRVVERRAWIAEATASATNVRAAIADLGDPADWDAAVAAHAAAVAAQETARHDLRRAEEAARAASSARDRERERHGGSAAEVARIRGAAERLADLRATVPLLQQECATRSAAIETRRRDLAALRNELTQTAARRDALHALRDALVRVDEERDAVQRADTEMAAAERAHAHARDVVTALRGDLDRASQQREEHRRADHVAALREGLVPGDRCPVCERVLDDVPPHVHKDASDGDDVANLVERVAQAEADLSAREADRRSCSRLSDESRKRHADAVQAVTALDPAASATDAAFRDRVERERGDVDAQYAALTARVQEMDGRIAGDAGALAEIDRRLSRENDEIRDLEARLGPRAHEADPVQALDAALTALQAVEQEASDAESRVTRATSHLMAADAECADIVNRRIAPLRQAVTVAATRLGDAVPAPEATPHDLVSRAHGLVGRVEAAAREADAAIAAAERSVAALTEEIIGRAGDLGVTSVATLTTARRAAESEHDHARQDLRELELRAAEVRRLALDAAESRRRAQVATVLANDLQANRFPRFLLGRFHERLARGATQRLLSLSNGAYAFVGADPDPLAVVDHRRGHRIRSAATLSGGERFLASLSLALAMADVASGTEGRLDCLFLDEGFSTLDAESLDLALAGVERMAEDGRLVVIITHLPGVAERLGGGIQVRKDAGGASHIVDGVGEPEERR